MSVSELIAKVEALKGAGHWECRWQDRPESFCSEDWVLFRDAVRGSLDAAVAFTEAMLPGWRKYVSETARGFHISLTKWESSIPRLKDAKALHTSEPIALVLATLRALEPRP
jgi:hypothetical protein